MSRSSKSPSKSRVPDPELERSLRKAVEQKYTEGKQEEISVNAVRRISEREIGLSEGFYINGGYWGGGKTDWKAESKSVIKDEVVGSQNSLRPAVCDICWRDLPTYYLWIVMRLSC